MDVAIDAASWLLLVLGAAFCVIGGIGMLRMPDVYTRSHAASLTDTLGAGLILLGLGLQAGPTLVAVKLIMIFGLLHVTSPTATHALLKSAYAHGVEAPRVEDEHYQRAAPTGSEGGRG